MNEALSALFKRASEHAFSKVSDDFLSRQEPYLSPSDEPLDWDVKGVVKLDAAMLALHMISARVAVRSVPQNIRQAILAAIRGAALGRAKKFATGFARLAPPLVRVAIFMWSETARIFSKEIREKEMERLVRAECLSGMKLLLGERMRPKIGRIRRTKRIASRNPRNARR